MGGEPRQSLDELVVQLLSAHQQAEVDRGDHELFDKAAASGAADGYAGSADVQRLYAKALQAADEMMANQKTSPVDGVVDTIIKALSSDSPDARYVVGRDASQLVMLRRFPQGLRDRLLMNTVGLKPQAFETNGGESRESAAA